MEDAEIQETNAQQSPLRTKLAASQIHSLSLSPRPIRTSAFPIPIAQRPQSSPPLLNTENDGAPVDLMSYLHRSAPSIVKTRSGSVLSRGFILKTDYYPSGRALDLDLNVHGAPNFRAPRTGSLNVFGAAQPRSQGLRAILSVLRARPTETSPSHVIWFSTREEPIVYISGRPFVLRDSSKPRKTLPLSDRPENLEAIEQRLKNDILAEGVRFGGLVLTHNEIALEDGDGAILPTWTAVDSGNVRTSRELWEYMRNEGWHVEYHRTDSVVSISIVLNPYFQDNYLDAYLHVIKDADPLRTFLVFSCGMGAVRTTFAMTAACIVRRRQLMLRGLPDPYATRLPSASHLQGSASGVNTPNGYTTPPQSILGEAKILQAFEQANAQQDLNRSLLRLTNILQQILPSGPSHQVIDLLLTNSSLLNDLRKAHMGNYGIILSLLGCLDDGLKAKKLVDKVIDSCDHVVNLREDILTHRIKYSLSSLEEPSRNLLLQRAAKALEKYFFTIAFASFVESRRDFSQTFSDWLKTRTEIYNQISFLRKSFSARLSIFSPVNDLSSLSKSGPQRSLVRGQMNDIAISGGQILGDEYSDHVVKNRSGIILREGTLLKSDQWLSESRHPTVEAIDEVIDRIKRAHPQAECIVWVTLREEPIVYVNGAPYCLRRERFSLRNMKDYGGISAERLEVLEERLRDDVLSELHSFGGKLLLHTETADGSVIPVWEEVRPGNVAVMKDVMSTCKALENIVDVSYRRVPLTAERPPDFSDFSELIAVMLSPNMARTPIVVNDQLGRGRSTLTSIILILLQKWLARPVPPSTSSWSGNRPLSTLGSVLSFDAHSGDPPIRRQSYQVINNLLRVIRKGPAVKEAVDDAIDQCAEVFNLRDSIEEARIRAVQASDERVKRSFGQKGLQNLRRYFELIVFQAYLQSTEPDTLQTYQTFEAFVKNLPVIKTFEKELLADGIDSLKPLNRVDLANGIALPDEVTHVVTNRSGSILSASTILKSDFFTNLQKLTLPERIEGAPNFRRVPLVLHLVSNQRTPSPNSFYFAPSSERDGKNVCGSGMPTVQGLRRALSRINAGPDGSNRVVWTSLREEPVIYVAGRPHVLRLVDRPLENVEATGITTSDVEAMEDNFKRDVIREVHAGRGRILLHDEVEERPNVFSIVPLWENVTEEDIMTPGDVYNLMAKEGYKIDYGRIAITDEQAPLPGALSQLLDRVTSTYESTGDFIFNCQMGRGRTTTGMVTACLIATTMNLKREECMPETKHETIVEDYDAVDGPSEEEAYLQGEYKIILQLVGILSHGKTAKRLVDGAIDLMQDVQNLRKAIYDNKLKLEACEKGSAKHTKLFNLAVNYLYRYGVLIVFANFLIERRFGEAKQDTFPEWLSEHREITKLLGRRSLD
ncbi:inositol hexakisphosphate-domain-containing protein [Multifurca ochricompacta]|uniref:Inositol hexakisphosphate-domain-containing protein n=1 Tax=Multifurca ochricompacta TaxID=376703 RepID=A0AAD4M639_9AGAM|nr:inositol hexakisphosphate-domain-containing protein [Multifurca ochricompacta]